VLLLGKILHGREIKKLFFGGDAVKIFDLTLTITVGTKHG